MDLAVEREVVVFAGEPPLVRLEGLPDELGGGGVEPGERLAVDALTLGFEDQQLVLLHESLLAGVLLGHRLQRLFAPTRTCNRIPLHACDDSQTVSRDHSPGTVLAAASAAQVAASLINFGLPALGPELQDEYDLSLFALGGVLTAGLMGSGLALFAAGWAVDRFGSRRTLGWGTLVGAVGLGATLVAPTALTLFLALVVFGIGSAVVPIGGANALFVAYPPARRGWAMGVRQTAVPLGGVLGALVFPALHDFAGVQGVLVVATVLLVLTGAWFTWVADHDASPRTERVEAPIRTILAAPGVQRLLVIAACYIIVLQAFLTYAIPALEHAGFSETQAAVAFVVLNATAMLGRIAWGRRADMGGGARRARSLVEVGLVTCAGALAFAASLHLPYGLAVAAVVLFAAGAFGWNANVYLSAGERTSPVLAGRAVAIAATVVFALSGITTPLLGAIADRAGWDIFWIITAASALCGAFVARGLRERSV